MNNLPTYDPDLWLAFLVFVAVAVTLCGLLALACVVMAGIADRRLKKVLKTCEDHEASSRSLLTQLLERDQRQTADMLQWLEDTKEPLVPEPKPGHGNPANWGDGVFAFVSGTLHQYHADLDLWVPVVHPGDANGVAHGLETGRFRARLVMDRQGDPYYVAVEANPDYGKTFPTGTTVLGGSEEGAVSYTRPQPDTPPQLDVDPVLIPEDEAREAMDRG